MPHFRKVEQPKVIIENGKELFLKACSKCSAEFYGDAKATRCNVCRMSK